MALVDLHVHTTSSDGIFSPTEVVHMAAKAKLAAVAITDHDTMSGVAEALQAGVTYGVEVIPGVEVSTAIDGKDIHILAYYPDATDAQWQQRLAQLLTVRDRRNEAIIQQLQQLGLDVSMEEVVALALQSGKTSGAVGRPHIGALLIHKGIVGSMQEAFNLYLAKGKPAFCHAPRPHPAEVISWIREAGGTSVIAHPGLYKRDDLVEQIIACGVQGIEVYHSDHTEEDEQRYLAMAHTHHLIVTAGSDFHGIKQGEAYHGTLGSKTVDTSVLALLRR